MLRDEMENDAEVRLGSLKMSTKELWRRFRSLPDDLREHGLTVQVHHDFMADDGRGVMWLMTGVVGLDKHGKPQSMAFKGQGKTDQEALDLIRAQYANQVDDYHHAPLCPANHYHGARAPTGKCTCGAVENNYRVNR